MDKVEFIPNKASSGAVTADDQFGNQIFHRFSRTQGRGAYMQERDEHEQATPITMYIFTSEDEQKSNP